MAKNKIKNHVCVVCGGTEDEIDIFRIHQLDDKKVCELCLQTVVAPASPNMFMNFVGRGEIVYEDIDKEIEYIETLDALEQEGDETVINFHSDGSITESVVPKETPVVERDTPKSFKSYLDKYAVGQDNAKRVLSVAIYNHFKRLKINKKRGKDLKKNNILLAGSTGVGKTFITSLLADKVDVPFVIADANSITQAGYVGGNVEDILESLFLKANGNLNKAQKGVVLIDEIDKLCSKEGRSGKTRDPSGKGAQEMLLKLIEGGEFKVDIGNGNAKHSINFDTKDVLFIVAGAFTDIEDIVIAREIGGNKTFLGGERSGLSVNEIYQKIKFDDFKRFGLIPELLGRLPIRVGLRPLTEDNLVEIMSKVENNLVSQYKELLADDGVDFNITKGALQQIARNAILANSGARGLQGVFEELLKDVMFDSPSDDSIVKFNITKRDVVNKIKEG
jgi:ATP-dependent Clp protease ATP-binding subunit ClpX